MIICPNCRHEEVPGALFCSECGAQLVFTDTANTTAFPEKQIIMDDLPGTAPMQPNMTSTLRSRILVHIIDNGKLIPVPDKTEFTVGRASEGQPITPDVDLGEFNAFDFGVSRLHIVVRLTSEKLSVMDLGSSNGTFVNGIRLPINTEQVISSGDVVSLGKFRIQILVNRNT
jgi:pSer/pThr/pTyr-binding forkhead associated (FHA) protein